MRRFLLNAFLSAALFCAPAEAFTPFDGERLGERPVAAQAEARGVLFYALAPSEAGVEPKGPDPAAGLAAAQTALARLEAADPAAKAAIDRLRAAGRVVVIYDPGFPYPALSRVTLAAFLPTAPDAAGGRRFVAVVGRYGAQRGRDALAAVLAHELAGHGVQHLEGRLGPDARVLDMECEAMLITARARRSLGLDTPAQRESVAFRKSLETRWCFDFRLWQAEHAPETRALWTADRLDAPALLALFRRYRSAN
ncbi:MAG: hypothetical protein RIB45_05240 [Marivibrio sp.]|uniref:hypothetical protein n=1 Tax=Marivibrio sp. TaxID=2039719 RepID=UPI0032EF0759